MRKSTYSFFDLDDIDKLKFYKKYFPTSNANIIIK